MSLNITNIHTDASSFHVHHSGDTHKAKAYIKWEGYLTADPDVFTIQYFDCIWRYTEWIEDTGVINMGNVTYISEEEYMNAYHALMQDCY